MKSRQLDFFSLLENSKVVAKRHRPTQHTLLEKRLAKKHGLPPHIAALIADLHGGQK